MEVYLLGSLLGLGYYLNNTVEPKPQKKKHHKKMYRGNTYDFEQYDRAENEVFDRAKVKFDEAQNLYENNTVGKYTPDVLFNKKSYTKYSKEKMQNENFSDYHVDDDGNKYPSNDNKNLNYSTINTSNKKEVVEHFSDPSPLKTDNAFATVQNIKSWNEDGVENYSLDEQFNDVSKGGLQGVKQVYDKKPFHNNMVPFFGGTMKQNVDPLANETKLNMYTGQWDYSKKQKKEIAPMFTPEKNIKNVYGDQQFLQKMDENIDRYIPSLLRTNEAPTEKVYVTPGLNLGYNEVAEFGFQDPVRALPKTTNELRAKNKPKLTYDRPVVSGKAITQNGTNRPNQNKNLPELVVYNEKGERNFGAKAVVLGEASRPTYLLGRAIKSFSRYFVGAAKATNEIKHKSTAGYSNNAKRKNHEQKYIAPATTTVKKNRVNHIETKDNTTKKTKRQTIEKNEHQGYFNNIFKALTSYVAPPKQTVKETTLSSTKAMNVKTNTGAHQSYFLDKAKQTLKESTENNCNGGKLNMRHTRKVGKVYNPDEKAKTTIRETTEKNNHKGNLKDSRRVGKVYNPDEKAKTTVRETTEKNDHEGNIKTSRRVGKVYNPDEKAKTTVRETTEKNDHEGNIKTSRRVGKVYNPDEKAKTTVRETTEKNDHEGNIKTSRRVGKVYNPDEKAKTTVRETTEKNDHEGNIKTSRRVGKVYNPDEKAKTTVRETTEKNDHEGNIKSTRLVGKVYDPEDKPEQTMKDIVKIKNYKGISAVATKKIKVWDPEDKAKYTSRQDALVEEYVGGKNSGQNGGAYEVTKVDPKYTSRQDTLIKDYTGTAGHTVSANQEYDAAYAAKTNANKEKIAKGRAPTQNSVKLAVGGDNMNVDIKRLDSDRKNPRDLEQDMPNCDVPYQLPPTANPYSITKEKNTVFNNNIERIQPDILDAFRNNPYTQSLHSYVFA
jgi:hypothetical protein